MRDGEEGESSFWRDTFVICAVLGLLCMIAWIGPKLDLQEIDAVRLLFFAIVALASAAGIIKALAILAEAYQIATRERSAHSVVQPSSAEPDTLSAVKPADLFGLWANNSLALQRDSVITGSQAYEHYVKVCDLNGVQPMSTTLFGTLLTQRAEVSGGAVTKTKNSGRMVYRGWSLVGEGDQGGREAEPWREGTKGVSLNGNSGTTAF